MHEHMITDGYAFEQETSYIQQKQITNIEPHLLVYEQKRFNGDGDIQIFIC